MIKSKLVEVFQSLNKAELRDLKQFIQSPIYNRHKEVIRLFEFLRSVKRFNAKTVDRKKAYAYVFGETDFKEASLRHVMTYLLEVLAQFLIYSEFHKDQQEVNIYLARAYRRKGIDKPFRQNMEALKATQGQLKHRNAAYFQKEYSLQYESFLHFEKQKRTEPVQLNELSKALDIRFITEKLKQVCTLLTYQSVYKKEYDLGLIAEIVRYIEERDLLSIPAISIYYHSYKALSEAEEIHFLSMKSLIEKYHYFFDEKEVRDLFLMAINFCIKRINQGQEENYGQTLFELYQQALTTKGFIENESLSRWTYINIVVVGLGVQAFDWVEHFIRDYKSLVEPAYQEICYNFNLANLAYKKKDYAAATQLLQQIDQDDVLLELLSRLLLLKIYFETKEELLLDSFLQSFENFVRRQKNIGYHKTSYLNFIKFTKKLLMLNQYDQTARKRMEMNIVETEILPEKKWLLEQLREGGF